MKLFFNYSVNCEAPDGGLGDPVAWDLAEASVRGFVDVMSEIGMRSGATLFISPDTARKQAIPFRQLADAGIEIALYLNGQRYSRMKKPAYLGSLPFTEQRAAIRTAKVDLEDSLGRPCLGFRACHASANDETFRILDELGFQWSSTSAAGSHRQEVFACWSGGWPFPYHPSAKNKLVAGDLKVYEMPATRSVHTAYRGDPDRPLGLCAETPLELIGPAGNLWRQVVEESIVEMERRNQPLRAIIGASRNSVPYANHSGLAFHNLMRIVHFSRQLASQHVYELTPAHFIEIKGEATEISAF